MRGRVKSLHVKTIDEYIAAFPEPMQRVLSQIRETIHATAPPGVREAIRYSMPTFIFYGNLVHFAAFKHHIGFYPAPVGVEEFREELSGYRTGKGSVQFPLDEPMPLDLIARIVQYRVEQNRRNPTGNPPWYKPGIT
ncbi:iron chaperone [Chitinophaga solisilvae]|uniref:YdhG-like domain-containing protein n=1 Tax=Chitinophaga solisilvae TaxID=1233460 RepID=A0A3S1BLW7_9BACT|nr:DUF1801 domain-containing protein [Chitinophaga solisilvae]NSL85941.1 hypothetical protein [Chitinophaga solisilvae]